MIISSKKIKIPDTCPTTCKFKKSFIQFRQQSICSRCPVFVCKKDKNDFCLIEAKDYRKDWAEEWDRFFKGKVDLPILEYNITNKHNEV